MKKEIILRGVILLLGVCFFLTGCAATPVPLRDYKPANPEEVAIIAVINAFEESFNKVDQKLFLSIMAEGAQIMHGAQRKIFTKEEYVHILPERIKEMGTIKFSNPKIKIERDIATVQAHYEGKIAIMSYSFELKKIGDKWLILSNAY